MGSEKVTVLYVESNKDERSTREIFVGWREMGTRLFRLQLLRAVLPSLLFIPVADGLSIQSLGLGRRPTKAVVEEDFSGYERIVSE